MQTSPTSQSPPSYFLSFHQGTPPPEDVKVDIWNDNATMTLLKTHAYLPDLIPQQRDRTYRRAFKYRWMGRDVYKIPTYGHMKIVPPPLKRIPLINPSDHSVHTIRSFWGKTRAPRFTTRLLVAWDG